MYQIIIRHTARLQQGEYCFATKKETQEFLETLTIPEFEAVQSITKFNKKSFRSAWYEFFED